MADEFSNLLWVFNGSQSLLNAAILDWEYATGVNISEQNAQYTNTGENNPNFFYVMKDKDPALPCSHWATVQCTSNFVMAPDVVSTDDVVTQNVPHEVTPNDIEELNILFKMIAFSVLAQAQGISFTWPTFPNCTR